MSDWWPGLEEFFTPGEEILIARNTADAVTALEISDAELERIRQSAFERALSCHTAEQRAIDLENAIEMAHAGLQQSSTLEV